MGNTASDSLDHSFQRFRLSQTEQLPLLSPSYASVCTSPKRKGVLNITRRLDGISSSEIAHDTDDPQRIVLYHNSMLSSRTTTYLSRNSKSTTNALPYRDLLSDNELIDILKSCTTSSISNEKLIHKNRVSSDEQMVMCLLDAKIIPELSDDELMKYVEHAYASKRNTNEKN
ncbi:unnamed protein product [Rotaria magnacalcarata]|uniref:Uncharacterized protein n=1 Tax=Rotaria magnacalcarata TaxID=392030 RepID=A0A816L7X0_9BILA|nr:unnamed protein product [Rotaria magnacalcarata]CAF1933983.1 unnamed protein product [Rotaria magnacalcarata]CAF4243650.1 unnamed protein product [Rotaria magnacalcarata]CAF4688942.1 unnamed protein product [Rotaria magnacalcarata]